MSSVRLRLRSQGGSTKHVEGLRLLVKSMGADVYRAMYAPDHKVSFADTAIASKALVLRAAEQVTDTRETEVVVPLDVYAASLWLAQSIGVSFEVLALAASLLARRG